MTPKKIIFDDKAMMASFLEGQLAAFTMTTHYYRNFLGLLYTRGIRYMAERAGAYWLIDAIASWQPKVRLIEREFQLWELVVKEDRSAELTARRNTEEPAIAHQRIHFTDFPLKSLTLYVKNHLLMLPSEHSGSGIN